MGTVRSVVWKGNLVEQLELMAAVQRNCECQFNSSSARVKMCASHAMLSGDQRALDGLLWSRRMRQLLVQQEGATLG